MEYNGDRCIIVRSRPVPETGMPASVGLYVISKNTFDGNAHTLDCSRFTLPNTILHYINPFGSDSVFEWGKTAEKRAISERQNRSRLSDPIRFLFRSKVGLNNSGIDRKIFDTIRKENGKRFVYFRNARFITTTRRPLLPVVFIYKRDAYVDFVLTMCRFGFRSIHFPIDITENGYFPSGKWVVNV